MKLAAGLAVGASALAIPVARCQEPKKAADSNPVDAQVEQADSLAAMMFTEQVAFKTDADTMDLWITSALDQRHGIDVVRVRRGTMRVFRANATGDDFTQKGGVYWKCGKVEGKFQFKAPGALVMVVRDQDGMVRCYSLAIDFRC